MRRLQLSGYPTITVHGEALSGPVTQRHRLALVSLLALSPARSLPREKVFALLWPESDIANARHLLNTAVHVIRRAAGDDSLVTRRDEVALAPDVEVDVLQFQDALQRGDDDAALRLYRAPLLDGFFLDGAAEFEQRLARDRERFASMYRHTLEVLAERAESDGNLTAAIAKWRQLNTEDPYNTRVVIRFMLALERLGDHGNAIELGHAHEHLLARELEAEPSAEFRELVRRMRDRPNGVHEQAIAGAASGREPSLAPVVTEQHRRRSTLGVVAAFAGGLAVTVWAVATWRVAPAPPSRVMIRKFENLSGDSSLAIIGAGVQNALTRAASQWSLIDVLLPTSLNDGSVRVTAGLGERRRVGTVIEGSYSLVADSIRLEARVVSTRDDRVIGGVRASWPRSAPLATEASLFASRVLGALAMLVDDRLAAVATPEHASPTFEAYQEFVIGLELHGKAEHGEAVGRFRRSLEADSQFTLASVWMSRALYFGARFAAAESLIESLHENSPPLPEADRLAFEWAIARFRGDSPAAYRAARRLVDLTPRSPWVLTLASEALTQRRPAEARDLVRQLEHQNLWVRNWSELVSQLGNALHLLGDYEDESALATRNRTTASNLIVRLISEARPLAAQGRLAEINKLVDEALALPDQPALEQGSLMQRIGVELLAHGHEAEANAVLERGRSWYEEQLRIEPNVTARKWGLANTLVRLGALDSARSLLVGMHARNPRMYSIQGLLAVVAVRQGDVVSASHFDSLLAIPDTTWNAFDDALRVFWRARAAARRDDRRVALGLLQEAVSRGVPMPLDAVHIESDLQTLRSIGGFDELTRLRR